MPRKNRKLDPYAQRALTEAELRFGPERSALIGILDSLVADAGRDVRQARTGARMVSQSAKQSVPEMRRIYEQAAGQQNAVNSMLAEHLAKPGPEANSFKLAAQIGTGGATARRAEEGARATSDLVSRQTDAIQGGVQETRGIRDRYRADAQKVRQQILSNRRQAGLYVQGRYPDLLDERADRRIKRSEVRAKTRDTAADNAREDAKFKADIDIKRGVDPITGRPLPKSSGKGGGSKGAGKKWAAPQTQAGAKTKIAEALSHAQDLKVAGRSRSEIAKILLQGRESQTIKDDKGNSVKVPGRPKIPELYLTAALDMTFGGGLHPATIRKLHEQRIRVKPLGYPRFNPGRVPTPATRVVKGRPG